ncbi:TPA: flagellin [Escherichia coli]
MAQVINTNSLSLITQNNINKNQSALSSSIERLSSGLRINSAKDDAAGQAIANRFTSNIKGLTQAARNANDGISVAQTTEGALSEINNNLQRIRELTVQATTGTNSDSDLDSIQDEIKSRLDEIDRVSGQTQFNGVNVLAKDGSMKIQVGANDGETITIDLKKIDSDTLGLNGFNVNGKGTITNKAATVSDLTSAGAKLNTTTGLYDLKTENTLLTTDAAFDKLGNGDKVTVGGVDYTYNAKSGDFTTTKSTAGTGVNAAAQTDDSASKRDALAATLHADVGKSVNGSYTTKDGTVSFETDSAGNITIGGSQAYVDDAGNLTTNNAGSAAKADMKALLKAASEGSDGASLTFNGTEYTIAKATPATTTPVAPLIPGGITYQATSTAGTGVNAAAQAADSASKRDALAATLHADVGKSVNGSYTTKDGTVSFETDSAGNITIGGSQAYVDDAGNLTTNNAGSAAKADMKALLKAASEGSDGASLTFNGTEYTIAKATPATTTPVATLIPGGITYQATVSKDVVLSETKAAAATSSITFNSGVLSKTIGFTAGESSDAAKSYVDDKGGITNVADYTVSYSVNKDNGSVTVAGYASATDTNKDYAPAIGTAVNVNSAGKITTETTSAGSATTNPLAALDDAISSIDKFRSSLGAIQNRLDSAVTNLNNTTTNLSEAQSRIQDADYATEVSNMSKAQIIQQAGNSVLAKANQVPQQVLSLLQG